MVAHFRLGPYWLYAAVALPPKHSEPFCRAMYDRPAAMADAKQAAGEADGDRAVSAGDADTSAKQPMYDAPLMGAGGLLTWYTALAYAPPHVWYTSAGQLLLQPVLAPYVA